MGCEERFEISGARQGRLTPSHRNARSAGKRWPGKDAPLLTQSLPSIFHVIASIRLGPMSLIGRWVPMVRGGALRAL